MLTVRVRNGDKKYDKVINDEGSIIVGNIFASEKDQPLLGEKTSRENSQNHKKIIKVFIEPLC